MTSRFEPLLALVLLAACEPPPPDELRVVWSDDDTEMLVLSGSHSTDSVDTWDLDIFGFDGAPPRRLRDGEHFLPGTVHFMRSAGYVSMLRVATPDEGWELRRIPLDENERTLERSVGWESWPLPSPDGSLIALHPFRCFDPAGCALRVSFVRGYDLEEVSAHDVALPEGPSFTAKWNAEGTAVTLVPRDIEGPRGTFVERITGPTIRIGVDGTVTTPAATPACDDFEAGTTSSGRAEDGRFARAAWDEEARGPTVTIFAGSPDHAFPGTCL